MSESMFFGVAIFVFIMLIIGLGLTAWEFKRGEPRSQDLERQRGSVEISQPEQAGPGRRAA